MSTKIFKNQEHQNLFDKQGFIVLPFLKEKLFYPIMIKLYLTIRINLIFIFLFISVTDSFGQNLEFSTIPSSNNDTISICNGNTVIFTDSSQNVPSGASYNWTFLDGQPSNAVGVGPHIVEYNVPGTYVVSLEVDSVIKNKVVVVHPTPNALIELQGTVWDIVTIDSVEYIARCGSNSSPIQFNIQTLNQTNQGSHEIIWGDGNVTNLNGIQTGNVSNTYTSGTYEMIYIYTDEAGCSDSVFNNIFIGLSPNAGIQFASSTVCLPGSFEYELTNFLNNPNGTTYTISFSDSSSPVNFQHPPNQINNHLFQSSSCGSGDNNNFFGSLTVENVCGVSQVENFGPIVVYESVTAKMDIEPDSVVCVGTNITITDQSDEGINITSSGCTTDYSIYWKIMPSVGYTINNGVLGNNGGFPDFFDFWIAGSSQINIDFIEPGTYEIILYAGNSYECGYDSTIRTICVLEQPEAKFILSDTSICKSSNINITNNSNIPACGVSNIYTSIRKSDF